MTLIRFALWNLGIRICDVFGTPLNALALWWERSAPDRESRIYGCMLHPHRLIDGLDIPESMWDRFGWTKP